MKRKITFLLSALFALTLITQSFSAMGQTKDPLTATFDWAANGNMGSNATGTVDQITLTGDANSANNPPAVTSNTLRIYAHRSDGDGASATFTAATNYKISAIQVTSSNGGSILKYATDGGSTYSGFSFSNNVATVSGLNVSSITLKNCQNSGNSNTTIQVSKVVITYASTSGSSHTLSSAVSPAAAGSVTLSETSLDEGNEATATASANTHFTFASWSITGGATLSSTTTNPTTITMGAANATVTATFTEDPKYNITYNANYIGYAGDPVVVSNYAGESMTIAAYNTFNRSGYVITSWNTAENGSGTAYSAGDPYTMTTSGLTLYAQWEESNDVTYDFSFTTIGTTGWTGSYADHSYDYGDAIVYFTASSKQTSTITDIPVTKTGPISIVMDEDEITAVEFVCRQWSDKPQTITLKYSTDGGDNYSNFSPAVTSNNFTISKSGLPTGTNAVQIVFSNSSNQIGVESATVTKAGSKHNVTCVAGEHGSLSASPAKASANQTVTLTVTPDSGFALSSLTAYKTGDLGTPVAITNNQITMPDYDITVSATFAAAYTMTFSVNGVTSTENYVQNSSITLPTPTMNIPEGFSFRGWSSSESNVETLLSSPYTVSATATIYAVFTENITITLTKADVPAAYESDETEISSDGIRFAIYRVANYDNNYIQLQGNNDYHGYIYNKDPFSNLVSIIATQTGTYREVTLKGGNAANPTSGTVINPSKSGMVDTYEINGEYSYIVLTNTTINALKYTSIVFVFDNSGGTRYTRVYGVEPVTENIAITAPTIIPSGSILDMDTYELSIGAGGSLVIEDGGQLICNNSVPATVKKKITAPTSASKDRDVYGWYTISSPVHDDGETTIAVGNVVNLVSNADPAFKYDMFAYSEADQKWINRKSGSGASGFDEMNKGQGYIYRNSGEELSFVGKTNTGAIDCPLSKESTGDLAGFNLIGNPYTHSITKGKGKAIDTDDASLTAGFYVLEDDTWVTYNDGDEIQAKQGVLIKATAAAATFQIKDVNYAPAKSNGDNIKFIVSNGQSQDVAYALFDKGIGLDKINHRSPEVPMLYINQDGQDYAIATMSDDTKAFNLNFKAGTIGKYTLSFNANDNFNYLHLIDLLTGEDVDILLEKEYSFIATPNDKDNRFIVKLGYIPNNNGTENEIFAYQNGSNVIVSGDGELRVFDVTGRMVATQRVNGVETINISAQGVYIFRLNEKVQKIVVR